jgi:hypothetical protein
MMQSNEEPLYKRARSKYISTKFVLYLLNGNRDSPLISSYWSSYYCCHELVVNESGNIVGKYCKARWCLTCNRIRTALIILGYGPQLRNLQDLQFMTLTAITCTKEELPIRIALYQKIWAAILHRNRNDCQRGHGRVLIGLRKCECTGRPDGMYHYHFHLLIEGVKNAEWVLAEWKKRIVAVGLKVSDSAQDIRPADEDSLMELAKYSTKIATKQKGKDDYLATAEQLDWIFQCLRGRRTYQPFGGLSAVEEEFEDDALIGQALPDGFEGWVWKWLNSDWVSEYGELLTGFTPSEREESLYNEASKERGQPFYSG